MQSITEVFSNIVKPYIDFADENLQNQVTGLIDNDSANGVVNSLGITMTELHSNNTEGSWSGETYTHNGATFACEYDAAGYLKKVTVNKLTGSDSSLYLKMKPKFPYLPIKLIGTPSGGGTSWEDAKYYLYYANWQNTTGIIADYGNGGIITSQFDYSTYPYARMALQIRQGETANNLIFYPMLIPSTIQGISNVNPVPYAKSNKELTEVVTNQLGDATLAGTYLSDCNNVASSGTLNIYGATSSTANSPYTTGVETSANSFVILARVDTNTNWGMQLAIPMTSVKGIFMRFKASGTWGAWSKITP